MKRFSFYVLTLLLGLWAQVAIHHMMGENQIVSNGLVIGVVYWGLSRGPLAGQVIGFFWGLLMDAASLGTLGITAWLWSLVGFVAGRWRRELDETKVWTQSLLVFVISIGLLLAGLLLERIFLPGDHAMNWVRLLEPFWNALVAPIVFRVLWTWDALWGMRELER